MPLSKEDLLKKRIRVALPVPFHPQFKVGDIHILDGDGFEYWHFNPESGVWNNPVKATEAERCPDTFQPLPWYAERELSDMPEYVRKLADTNRAVPVGVYQVEEWIIDSKSKEPTLYIPKHINRLKAKYFTPATREEWEAQQNGK